MAMLDSNLLALPKAKSVFALMAACAAFEAILTIGQAFGIAWAITLVWYEGLGGGSAAGAALGAAGAALDGVFGSAGSSATALPSGFALGLALFLGCLGVRQLVRRIRLRLLHRYADERTADLADQLGARIYAGGTAFRQREGAGKLATALVDGLDSVHAYIALLLPKFADLAVIPALLAIAILALDWISGIIAIALLPCIIFYMRMLGANARAAAASQHGEYIRMSNHFADTIGGMQTIRESGSGQRFGKRIFDVSERLRNATVKTMKTATLSSLTLDLFRTFGLAAVAIMLGFRLMSGSIQLLPALTVLILVPEYFTVVRSYASDFHASLEGRTMLASILEMIAAPEPAPREFLRDVRIDAPRGCKVGIVGASGAGKSTLANCLAGFDPVASGAVIVNGQDMATVDRAAWAQHIAYIPQNPHLFSATLRDNIRFYQPAATDAEILAAIEAAGLDTLLAQLPAGLDTLIGEGGRTLSGGQAQRVALARVFVDRERTTLIFDEPTAHLDIETELAMKPAMLALMEGRTVFFATHRMHWMRDMDRIVELRNGAMVANETAADFIERQKAGEVSA